MKTLFVIFILAVFGSLSGCGPLGKKDEVVVEDPLIEIERRGPLGELKNITLRTQYSDTKREGDGWEQPFIVLFTGNSGNIAGYWRVEGSVEYYGPKFSERTFKVACEGETCTAVHINAYPQQESYIKFRTVDGCSFRWAHDFLLSEHEVTILKKPLISKCTPTPRKRTYSQSKPSKPSTSVVRKTKPRAKVVRRCPAGYSYSAQINKCYKCGKSGGKFNPKTRSCR